MKGQTVFITGASSGFGEACARLFAFDGNRLIITARRLDKLKELQAELKQNCPVHIIQLDVQDRAAVDSAIAKLPEGFHFH